MANTGFKGIDVRQTGNQLVFRAFLTTSGAVLTSGTGTLELYEIQSDGTLKSYDFADNTFKTTTLTTATLALTHRTGNNSATNTGIWTAVLSTLTGFTAGGMYLSIVRNSSADTPVQAREFQYGSEQGDQVVTAVSTGVGAVNVNTTHIGGNVNAGAPGSVNVSSLNSNTIRLATMYQDVRPLWQRTLPVGTAVTVDPTAGQWYWGGIHNGIDYFIFSALYLWNNGGDSWVISSNLGVASGKYFTSSTGILGTWAANGSATGTPVFKLNGLPLGRYFSSMVVDSNAAVVAASVTGNVGGNVAGSVASVTAAVNTNANATETAIKAKTDNLPASPAAVGSQMDLVDLPNANALTAIKNAIWAAASRTLTAFGFTVDTNANSTETAIKAKTDNLPSDPADQSLIIDATNALATAIGSPAQASVLAAVKLKTDNLPSDPADQSLLTTSITDATADIIAAIEGLPTSEDVADQVLAGLTGRVTVISPLSENGETLELVTGDSYTAAMGTSLKFNISGMDAAVGSKAYLVMDGATLCSSDEITLSTQQIVMSDLLSATTLGLTPGSEQAYQLRFIAGTDTTTPINGLANIKKGFIVSA